MKKISVIFLIIGVIAIAAYFFVRHSLNTPGFTPAEAKEPVAETKHEETVLDLRPKLIEKLQQLVKQGSNGLYNLSVHEVNPDVLNSTVGISHAMLVPDTAALKEFAKTNHLPSEVFKIESDSIWITGLGIKDILSKDVIDVKTIHIYRPVINVYSEKASNDENRDSKTLYQRLMNQMKHIGIGRVIIEKGTLIHHSKNKSTKFDDIAISLSNIAIDSTTQYDHKRFLFAKEAELSLNNYSVPTSDHLYTFKIGTISVAATKQLLVAKNIVLQPNYTKEEFQKHLAVQNERYEISVPSVSFKTVDWWNLINEQKLEASFGEINIADIKIYLDRRLPSGPEIFGTYPHQLLMKLPLKVNIQKLNVNDLDLSYEEFSKASGKPGKFFFNNMHGSIYNVTNMPEVIKRNKTTTVHATGTFMNIEPTQLDIYFDLANYRAGTFSADFQAKKTIDGTAINSIAEPLGLFMVKRGELKELSSHVRGDNYKASGNVTLLYSNLHLTPLKKDESKPNGLKKKSVTSLIANTFVLKDENPSKDGEVRKVTASYTRGKGTFFNLIWKTIFVGILKTIGAPEKLAYQ